MPQDARHRVVVEGGSAGTSVAACLRRAGESDVAVVDPASTHPSPTGVPTPSSPVIDTTRKRRGMWLEEHDHARRQGLRAMAQRGPWH